MICLLYFEVYFLDVVLGLIIYILTYENQLQIYTTLILVMHRNINSM